MTEKDRLIAKYGERWRGLIEHSLDWLDRDEPEWNLSRKRNREQFIIDLIRKAVPPMRQ